MSFYGVAMTDIEALKQAINADRPDDGITLQQDSDGEWSTNFGGEYNESGTIVRRGHIENSSIISRPDNRIVGFLLGEDVVTAGRDDKEWREFIDENVTMLNDEGSEGEEE